MAPRERNPERSRERILDAARTEFAAHGLAGARVEAIARRAGLNKQLISHHFGGKDGLYRAVMAERRLRLGGEMAEAPDHLPEALGSFFERARHDPEWVRVLLWETLEVDPDTGRTNDEVDADGATTRRARYVDRVAWVQAEQAAGRLPRDLDATLTFMSLLGAALYPVLLPELCLLMTGHRPDDEEFATAYRGHLDALAASLAQSPIASTSLASAAEALRHP